MQIYAVIGLFKKRPNTLLSFPALSLCESIPKPLSLNDSSLATYHLVSHISKDDLESFYAIRPLKIILMNFSDVSIALGLLPRCFLKIDLEEQLDYMPPQPVFSIDQENNLIQ